MRKGYAAQEIVNVLDSLRERAEELRMADSSNILPVGLPIVAP